MKTKLVVVFWLAGLTAFAQAGVITVSNLTQLAEVATRSGQTVKLQLGVYRMADYLTPPVLEKIHAAVDRTHRRPPVPMIVFRGSNNHFDFRDATIEIDTDLYAKLPGRSYIRCLIVAGNGNHFDGLTIRNTGPQKGSSGNILSVAGASNTLENITLHVRGSFPYGYGDLLGKGGPNLVPLQKQSGIQILGTGTTLRRCKVFSRAFGHCFYIQGGNDIRLENCLAEGEMRATSDMLRDTNGPAHELGFRSVFENRDGRYLIVPGYTKSLVEDGFRTYSTAGNVTLVDCTAVNTRAGFEIGARDDSDRKTVIENCLARGCERGYLLGSHVIVRRSRGDVLNGPLLYLRGGLDADVELELTGAEPVSTVHALATIAGKNHRVRLTGGPAGAHLPIMLGFGMPAHAEMASPIKAEPATGISLVNELPFAPIIQSDQITNCTVRSSGLILSDAALRAAPGSWGDKLIK
jgi:hypothetical protein